MQNTEDSRKGESSRIATEQTTSFNDVLRPTDSTATNFAYDYKAKGKATETSTEFSVAEVLAARKKDLAKFRADNPDYAEHVDVLEMSNPEATKNDEKECKAQDIQSLSNERLLESLARCTEKCTEKLDKLSKVISKVERECHAQRQVHAKARFASPYGGYGHPGFYHGNLGLAGLDNIGSRPAPAFCGHVFPVSQQMPTVKVYLNGQPYESPTGSRAHPGAPQFFGYNPYFGGYPATSQFIPYRVEVPEVSLTSGWKRRCGAGGQNYFGSNPDNMPRSSSASAVKPKSVRVGGESTTAGTASQDAATQSSRSIFPENIGAARNKEAHAEASRSVGGEYQASVEDCRQCRDYGN